MVDRTFNETDLRLMLTDATNHRPDVEPGRWVIETTRANRDWEVIVEPDTNAKVLVVITAYSVP
jgi:hypothetical protein